MLWDSTVTYIIGFGFGSGSTLIYQGAGLKKALIPITIALAIAFASPFIEGFIQGIKRNRSNHG